MGELPGNGHFSITKRNFNSKKRNALSVVYKTRGAAGNCLLSSAALQIFLTENLKFHS